MADKDINNLKKELFNLKIMKKSGQLTDTSQFPATGEIRIGTEDISYTTNNTTTNILSGGAREVNGTTKAAHSGGVTVTNISDSLILTPFLAAWTIAFASAWVVRTQWPSIISCPISSQCFRPFILPL